MWQSTVRLGVTLSVVVAVAAVLLAGRVSDQALLGGVFLIASALGWANVERFRPTNMRAVPVRRS